MLSRMSRNRMAGRLEGTHAFLRNNRPEVRTHRRFLNQIDLTTEQRGELPTKVLQPAKMVEPPGREACSRPDRQIHVGRVGRVATSERAERGDRLAALRAELRLVRPENCQQRGARSW